MQEQTKKCTANSNQDVKEQTENAIQKARKEAGGIKTKEEMQEERKNERYAEKERVQEFRKG